MNDMDRNWRFCVVGNIVRQHSDGEKVFHGTKAFSGGTKVYINDRTKVINDNNVTVIGLNRFKRYAVENIPMELIENIRIQKIYKPTVLKIIDHLEFMDGFIWRGRTSEDRIALEKFVKEWNEFNDVDASD